MECFSRRLLKEITDGLNLEKCALTNQSEEIVFEPIRAKLTPFF